MNATDEQILNDLAKGLYFSARTTNQEEFLARANQLLKSAYMLGHCEGGKEMSTKLVEIILSPKTDFKP